MIPDIFKPYLEHPLVENKLEQLEDLDSPQLNDIIRAEDLMIRGIRDFYLNPDPKKNKSLITRTIQLFYSIGAGAGFLRYSSL